MSVALTILIDRLIQLLTLRQERRKALLAEDVEPVFAAFEAVHKQYLDSFRSYRESLGSLGGPASLDRSILERLRTDNQFTSHDRERILQLSQVLTDSSLRPFLTKIHEYLVDVRVTEEPLGGYRGSRFANPQHWRRTLARELESIIDESWQVVLDPNSSAPPLYGEDLEARLREVRVEAGIPESDPDGLNRLKAWFAIRALDEVVDDMQAAYAGVAAEWAQLRVALRK